MNVRDISNDGLRQIIHEWLERGGERRGILDRHPLLAANVEHLEEARDAFARLAPARGAPAEEARTKAAIDQLDAQIDAADDDFDHPARVGLALLDLAIEVTDDEVTRAQLAEARGALFPRGLKVTTLKPAEEAGVARALDEALDDERRALLGRIELKVGAQRVTVLSLVAQQIAAGKRLGKLVAKRDQLVAARDAVEPDEADERSALVRFGEARNLIVSAVRDFVRDVERTRQLSAADRALLLATVTRLSPRPRSRKGAEGDPAGGPTA